MKKLLVIVIIILCGCESTQTWKSIQDTNKRQPLQGTINEPPKTIRNPKCEDIAAFKVFQVLNNYVLAFVCRDSDGDYCFGHTVYFQRVKGVIYFDDQIIKVKSGECAIYTGTYQYATKGGDFKTVPIVKIINAYETE